MIDQNLIAALILLGAGVYLLTVAVRLERLRRKRERLRATLEREYKRRVMESYWQYPSRDKEDDPS